MALKAIFKWVWAPFLITSVAITGILLEWPVEVLTPVLGGLFISGLIGAIVGAREKEYQKLIERLRHQASYFSRRFLGDSSFSIFTIINSLFKTENTKLWEWARACDMAQRVFNSWGNAFNERLEVDSKSGRFGLYLRPYLNELWMMNNLYYEFIEQFHEIAEKVEIPPETLEQYNRFSLEYNAFAENFRSFASDSLKAGKTEIEAPSIKSTMETRGVVAPQQAQKREEPKSQPTRDNKGYYI